MRSPWLRATALLLGTLGSLPAWAAAPLSISIDPTGPGSGSVAGALRIVIMLTLLALLPAIVIAMTSFTRTIIVLSILRHAFGINKNSFQPFSRNEITVEQAVTAGVRPLREFMIRQTREKDLQLMMEVAHAPIPDSVEDVGTVYIVPAFLLSELKTAFQIGFVIFLPFLLLDLVVASILMSMGMLMVPPTIVSLPLKILMFVLIDGWGLTVRALLGSFH
jgi:flagellar biosynthesis protein FliP